MIALAADRDATGVVDLLDREFVSFLSFFSFLFLFSFHLYRGAEIDGAAILRLRGDRAES